MQQVKSIVSLRKLVLFFVVVIGLGSCQESSVVEETAEERGLPEIYTSEELQAALDSVFMSEIGAREPGAGILISYNGQAIISKGYGLENISSGSPISPETNFRMASVSKQFTALAVLTLVDNGQLNLDDPVNKLLGISGMEGVQVHHLLNHTSGIPVYDNYFENEWNVAPVAENSHVLSWYHINNEPTFEPGSKWEYSNGAYNLLATIVESVSGQPFHIYTRENVFEPMGMKATNYFNLAHPINIPNRAYCYEEVEGKWNQVDGNKLNGLVGEGAVYTSLRDYGMYEHALRTKSGMSQNIMGNLFQINQTPIVDAESTFPFVEGNPVWYHNGWFVSNDVAFHAGGWKGTSTFVMRGLKSPLTIAVFRNSNEDASHLVSQAYLLTKSYLKHTL